MKDKTWNDVPGPQLTALDENETKHPELSAFPGLFGPCYLARRSLCEIIHFTLGMLIH